MEEGAAGTQHLFVTDISLLAWNNTYSFFIAETQISHRSKS